MAQDLSYLSISQLLSRSDSSQQQGVPEPLETLLRGGATRLGLSTEALGANSPSTPFSLNLTLPKIVDRHLVDRTQAVTSLLEHAIRRQDRGYQVFCAVCHYLVREVGVPARELGRQIEKALKEPRYSHGMISRSVLVAEFLSRRPEFSDILSSAKLIALAELHRRKPNALRSDGTIEGAEIRKTNIRELRTLCRRALLECTEEDPDVVYLRKELNELALRARGIHRLIQDRSDLRSDPEFEAKLQALEVLAARGSRGAVSAPGRASVAPLRQGSTEGPTNVVHVQFGDWRKKAA